MAKAYVVFVTVGSRAEAEALAEFLVTEQLAACVNLVGPVTSIYRWKGAVERSEEILCVMKTTKSRFAALKKRILELHSYELPEVIAVPVDDGHAPYLRWVADSTAKARPKSRG